MFQNCFCFLEIEEIRKDKDGNDLPNARRITRRLVSNEKKTSSTYSATLMAFGQFMDHDLTQTPVFRGNDGSFLNCCQFFPLPKVCQSVSKGGESYLLHFEFLPFNFHISSIFRHFANRNLYISSIKRLLRLLYLLNSSSFCPSTK